MQGNFSLALEYFSLCQMHQAIKKNMQIKLILHRITGKIKIIKKTIYSFEIAKKTIGFCSRSG